MRGVGVPIRKRARTTELSWVYPGLVCDCECTNDLYEDVFHPVRVLSLNNDGETCQVLFLAWNIDQPPDTVQLSLLFPLAPACPSARYSCGDSVLFRCWKRKIGTKLVDGLVGNDEGVWIRGTIEKLIVEKGGDIDAKIRHTDWENGTTKTWTNVRHLRPAPTIRPLPLREKVREIEVSVATGARKIKT